MMESEVEEGNLLFTDEYKKALEKASYEIVGNHSAVEICGWTKKGMKSDSGGCYKQKFYGTEKDGEYFPFAIKGRKWIVIHIIFSLTTKIDGSKYFFVSHFVVKMFGQHF